MHLLRLPHLVILSSLLLIVLLAVAPGVSANTRPNSSPAITLSPAVGPPTSTVQVSGTNFGSNEKVDVYFDTTDEALTSTNSQGKFSTSFQVPAGATPGTHTVSAVGRSSKLKAQAPFLVQTDWAQFRYAPRNTGNNPYENVLGPANVANLKVSWFLNAGTNRATPVVVGGVAYIAAGNMDALNAATGTQIWSAAIGADTSPAVVGGVVYVGSYDKNLYALNAQTGAILWKAPITHGPNTPTVVNGIVYVGSGASAGGQVFALNAQTGASLWTFSASRGNGSLAVYNGVVYVAGGKLYALNATTGVQRWVSSAGGMQSTPVVEKGVVYTSAANGVRTFNAGTGALLWTATIGSGIDDLPAIANGIVYIAAEDGKLHALNASTGVQLWSTAIGGYIYSSPSTANGVVYIGSDDTKVYALNAQTGAILWSYTTGAFIAASPAVVNGMVYIGSYNNYYAFALPSQKQS